MYEKFSCRNCVLHKKSTKHILPAEPTNKSLLVILSQTSPEQQKSGSYMESKTWQTVKSWISNAGIETSDVHFTGLLRCAYSKMTSNEEELKQGIGQCFNWLAQEIDAVNPKVILLLGKDAYEAFGGTEFSRNIGKPFVMNGVTLISSYSPSNLAARPDDKGMVAIIERNMAKIKALLTGGDTSEKDYRVVKTWEEVEWLVKKLHEEPNWVFDIEGTSLDFFQNEITGVGFSWTRNQGCFLPMKTYVPILGLEPFWGERQEEAKALLKSVLENDSTKGAHNGKFDVKNLFHEYGIVVKNFLMDSLLLSSLMNPGRKRYGLDFQSEKYPDLAGYKKDAPEDMMRAPLEQLRIYNNKDTDLTYRIIDDEYAKLVEDEKLVFVFDEILMPLSDLTTRMEYNGIRVDTEMALKLHLALFSELEEIMKKVEPIAGKKINVRSPDQLAELLYTKLRLPVIEKSKTTGKPGTSKEVLQELLKKTDNPILKDILNYRSLAANKGVFVDGFVPLRQRKGSEHKDYILDKLGYYHGNYKLWWTNTGRLSSGKEEEMEEGNSLNLQNIPRDKRFRRLFVPDVGHLWVGADHAQLELRILNHECKDPSLNEAFELDYDPHSYVASAMTGWPYEEIVVGYKAGVEKYYKARSLSKNIGFGWVYLAKDGRFAFLFPGKTRKEQEKAEKEAKQRYFDRFSRIAPWRQSVIENAREFGYIRTTSGRKINIDNINNENEKMREHAERQAVNAVIQATASDLTAYDAIQIDKWITANGVDARILNLVHDAIYVSCHPDSIVAFKQKMKSIMETKFFGLTTKLKADVEVSDRWDGEKVEI